MPPTAINGALLHKVIALWLRDDVIWIFTVLLRVAKEVSEIFGRHFPWNDKRAFLANIWLICTSAKSLLVTYKRSFLGDRYFHGVVRLHSERMKKKLKMWPWRCLVIIERRENRLACSECLRIVFKGLTFLLFYYLFSYIQSPTCTFLLQLMQHKMCL